MNKPNTSSTLKEERCNPRIALENLKWLITDLQPFCPSEYELKIWSIYSRLPFKEHFMELKKRHINRPSYKSAMNRIAIKKRIKRIEAMLAEFDSLNT